jgi:predicted  nucleic acid-binding Zn-ribbon protein
LVDTLEKDVRELIELARGIERQMKQFPERKQELEAEKNSVDEDLKKTRDHLARLGAI